MDDNYFDPSPETPFTPSSNLAEDDPLRQWASQLQDPDLMKLMATDPQAAAKKMSEMGIPPPPPHIMQYTDGLGPENSPQVRGGNNGTAPGTYGGAPPEKPFAQGSDPLTAGTPPKSLFQRGADMLSNALPVFGADGKMKGNQTSAQGQEPAAEPPGAIPLPVSDPRKTLAQDLDPEINPSGGLPLVPRARPAEAPPRATDMSAQKKPSAGDALSDFSKSIQGVKPVPPPAPNFVGTPSVRAHGNIGAPNLQSLLSLVGQPPLSPLGFTLGRLLATGKA